MNAHRRQLYAEIEQAKDRADRAKRILLAIGIASIGAFMLASCVSLKGNGSEWSATAVLTDVKGLDISATGATVDDINHSVIATEVSKRIKQMLDAYLIYEGLTFLGGKYYDKAGQEISSAQSVKLSEIQSAKDIKTAELKLEELKLFPPE